MSKGNDAQSKNLPSEIQNGQDRGEPSASKAQASVGSPFSGLDLTVLLGGGLLLIASGVTLSGWVVRRARV